MKKFLFFLGLFLSLVACKPEKQATTDDVTIPADETFNTIMFTPASGAVTNPERGLYKAVDYKPSSNSYLKASSVQASRLDGFTLWYLGFYLDLFMNGDISETYLNRIQRCMDGLREGGAKCILRFAYSNGYTDGTPMDNEDPEISVVLRHIEQLKPILQKNEDVIFVMQAGFVGTWGEWYYTEHFNFQPTTDADFQPRKKVAEALLKALPTSRQIALRTPQFKMRMYGLSVKDTLTSKTAHDGSTKSRLAGHNDCFGASTDDYGTFDNEENDRDFWKADTRYTIMGGETCGLSNYCKCPASLADVKDYHWTYLNSGYNSDVLNRWKEGKCFDEIVNRLGYRLVLKELDVSESFAVGRTNWLTFRLENQGFAAPMNPRNVSLVWKGADGKVEEKALKVDPRTWHPGAHEFTVTFTPSTTDYGTLYLKLSDPLLPDRPEYCIALANQNVFDASTGLNKLFNIR